MPDPAREIRFGMGLANEELLQFGSSVSLKDPCVEGLALHLPSYVDMGQLQKFQKVPEGCG